MLICLGLVMCAVAPGRPAHGADGVTIVFVDRSINTGVDPIDDYEVRLAVPETHPGQTVHSCRVLPQAEQTATDQWGRTIARWPIGALAPGQMVVRRWIAEATIRPWHVKLDKSKIKPLSTIAPKIRDLYLADGPKYNLAAIKKITDRLAPRPKPVPDLLKLFFDYVISRLQYTNDDKWCSADIALAGKSGSCSEYSFAFIAMCRARGIPARYVGGTARRSVQDFYIDCLGHRWVEVHLPGLGWVPFDPTRSDGNGNTRRYFGRAPENCLVISAGDGAEQSLLEWQSASYHAWPAAGGQVHVGRHGWWLPATPAGVQTTVLAWAEKLNQAANEQDKRRLIVEAQMLHTRFVLPWLDDLLYDSTVRLKTARTIREIGGNAAVVAVIDCLAGSDDPKGDAQLGRLLEGWTGQRLGHSPERWRAWMSTKAFSAFISAGQAAEAR